MNNEKSIEYAVGAGYGYVIICWDDGVCGRCIAKEGGEQGRDVQGRGH